MRHRKIKYNGSEVFSLMIKYYYMFLITLILVISDINERFDPTRPVKRFCYRS